MAQTVIAESQKKNAESRSGVRRRRVQRLRSAASFGGDSGHHHAHRALGLSLSLVAAHPMFIGAFIVFFTVWLAELLAAGLRPDPTQLHNAVQTATDWTWLVQTRFPPCRCSSTW